VAFFLSLDFVNSGSDAPDAPAWPAGPSSEKIKIADTAKQSGKVALDGGASVFRLGPLSIT
jgi:hypothetical protein